ncbi:MAG: ubiquinol-cytochrome c reductase iron-sulfur subunit N-terminal domain-containing protein, partial [Woeseiaceae bacterium]
MSEDDADRIDRNRRHFLTVATAVTGVAGAGVALYPFLAS